MSAWQRMPDELLKPASRALIESVESPRHRGVRWKCRDVRGHCDNGGGAFFAPLLTISHAAQLARGVGEKGEWTPNITFDAETASGRQRDATGFFERLMAPYRFRPWLAQEKRSGI